MIPTDEQLLAVVPQKGRIDLSVRKLIDLLDLGSSRKGQKYYNKLKGMTVQAPAPEQMTWFARTLEGLKTPPDPPKLTGGTPAHRHTTPPTGVGVPGVPNVPTPPASDLTSEQLDLIAGRFGVSRDQTKPPPPPPHPIAAGATPGCPCDYPRCCGQGGAHNTGAWPHPTDQCRKPGEYQDPGTEIEFETPNPLDTLADQHRQAGIPIPELD